MTEKEKCCGCSACAVSCPNGNIQMKEDSEGFLYPTKSDGTICGDCNVCSSICFYNKEVRQVFPKSALACKIDDDAVRFESSSGGIFSALAEYTLEKSGVICGALFNDNCKLVHSFAEDSGYKKFRGSKYVQSDLSNCFVMVEEHLKSGKLLFFSGTPCQIAGLKSYLSKDYENLLCMGLICHGVPSSMMFRAYIKEVENRANSKVIDIKFRNKEKAWKKNLTTKAIMQDGSEVISKNDQFYRGYLARLYQRPSCHSCFANNYRSGADVIVGDYWGCETIHKDFDDDKGISLVMLHTEKAINVFKEIGQSIISIETDLSKAIIFNGNIIKSSGPNRNRDELFRQVNAGKPFSKVVRRLMLTPWTMASDIAGNIFTPAQIRWLQKKIRKFRK